MILQGKCALISGGSRGIGRGIAELYYKEGAELFIMSRNPEQLEQAAKEIDVNNEGRVHALPCDVGNEESVNAAFEKIKAMGKDIEILVNCAGINIRDPLDSMPLENWNKVISVNLTGAFLLTQRCYEMMKRKGGGKIVNIASLMSEIARPSICAYTAAKGGIKMFTRATAIEWAKDNIQCNAIIPGYILTELNAPLINNKEFYDYICQRTPVGRWGKPEEIAAAALFFASKGADFVTGQVLAVDGGILAAL